MSNVTIKIVVIDNSIKRIIELIINKQWKDIKGTIVKTVKEANTVVICSEDYSFLPPDALKGKQVIILQKSVFSMSTITLEQNGYFCFKRELFAEHSKTNNKNIDLREAHKDDFLEILQQIETRLNSGQKIYFLSFNWGIL